MELTNSIKKNINRSDSQRISFFEYLYVFVLIIYAGHANTFVEYLVVMENPVGVFLPIVLSVILATKWNIIFNKQFYLLIFGFFIYFMAISIKYKEIHPNLLLLNLWTFFIVYASVKALKFNLFRIYEYLLYGLSIIGLLMWILQTILGGDSLFNYFSSILSNDSFSYVSGRGLTAIIYSVQPTSASLLFNYLPPRNCGFAWEPGGFAVYLCLAIFINLFVANPDPKGKIRFWVLLLALISTQSTTGYAIFTIIMLFYYLNKKLNIVLLILPIIITASIFIFSLPFMSNKIISLVNETNEIDLIVAESIGIETQEAPQRFTSFMIAIRDFYNNPILGLGSFKEESWTSKIGANISPITGIGNLLANYGIIGFLFFIILSIKTSFLFSKYFSFKGNLLIFFIILFISISYSIILFPLVMCFWMFAFFEPLNTSPK
jgi:hypothetical protein